MGFQTTWEQKKLPTFPFICLYVQIHIKAMLPLALTLFIITLEVSNYGSDIIISFKILKKPMLVQKQTVPRMKVPLFSFLEPKGKECGIIMELPLAIPFFCLKVYKHYGNTGCGIFKRGIQNLKDFCLRINCQNLTFKVNFLLQKSSESFSFFFHWRILI